MRAETLQSMIEQATSGDLAKPDFETNKKICTVLQQSDYLVPDAINLIRGKLLKRNTKVQCLAVLLLGNAVRSCSGRLHQEIATEEFMGFLVKLLHVQGLSITVQHKLLELIEMFATFFSNQTAQYPIFQTIYEGLKKSGFVFSGAAPSAPVSAPSQAPPAPLAPPPRPAQSLPPVQQAPAPPPVANPRDPLYILSKQDQYTKLRKDLKLLVENIKLVNEIIDGENSSTFGGNDVLKDLMTTLKQSDRSLQLVLVKFKEPELLGVMHLIDADLQKTFSRYTDLTRYQKPEGFVSAFYPKSTRPNPPPVTLAPPRPPVMEPASNPNPSIGFFDNPPETTYPSSIPDLMPSQPPRPPVQTVLTAKLTGPMSAMPPTMNPQPIVQPVSVPPAPSPSSSAQNQEVMERLNSIMKQMELKDQEKRKQEEARKVAEMQYATAYGMLPMMNPTIFNPYVMGAPMNPMMPFNPNVPAYNPMANPGTNFLPMSSPQPGFAAPGFQPLKPEVAPEPARAWMEESEKKDAFGDMFDLANKSITSRPQPRKANPFDDEAPGYKAVDTAAELFGGRSSQKAAEDLFGGGSSSNDMFGPSMTKPQTDPFGGPSGRGDMFGGTSNASDPFADLGGSSNMYGGMSNMYSAPQSEPRRANPPSNDLDFF